LALPTKVAPKTAAFYLKNVIDELIEKGWFGWVNKREF
jgi:predicted DNA-binding transcriptional regulator